MKQGFSNWILVILILLSFGRGIWALGEKSLWWDESLSLHRARGTLTSVLTNEIVLTDNIHSIATVDNHPPLYFLLLWVAVRLLGQSDFSLRFLSLVSIVLIVPLLYLTGRRLVDEWAGLTAAALGALSPMYLWYGQEARMYAMLALFSLLSFYTFLRAFFHPAGRFNIGRHWPWVVAFGLTSACLILIHYFGMLVIAFELLALAWVFLRQAASRRVVVLTVAAIILVLLPLAVYAWLVLPRGDKQPGFRFVPLWEMLRDALSASSLGLSVDIANWFVLLIDLVFVVFLILGFVWLVRRGASQQERGAGWLLVGYLLVPLGLIYLQSYVQPVYMNSRHLIYITPAFYLLVAVGLTRWRGRVWTIALLGGLLMVGGIGYSTWNYFSEPAYDKDHHREWGAYLREQVRPGDVVVVDPPHIAELYQHYAGSGVPWVGLPVLGGSREQTAAILEDLFREYDRVWLAFSYTPPWGDKGRFPQRWLDQNAYRFDYKSFHSYASSVWVAGYLPDWPSVDRLPGDAQLMDVRYSPSLRLEGYHLVSPPQSGKLLHVELFWAIDEPIPEEASVGLRLVDDQGQLWGQGEQCPFNGLYPMWQWQPGLTLRDEHEVLIPPGTPPGNYQLELVLISRPTEAGCLGARGELITPMTAPAHVNRGDRVLLGAVDVQRAEVPAESRELGIEQQRRARFGGLTLLGSSLAPTALKAGERLDVTVYWEAQETPLPDAVFSLRLVEASGEILQETTIRPVGDGYPAERWQEGDRFKGQFRLWLPEDATEGRYAVELVSEPPLQRSGVWAALRRRLGAEDVGVRLGNVEVLAGPGSGLGSPATPIPLPSDLVVSNSMLATLGDRVRFLGYDLQTASARAGETLSFTLYWQALRPMDISYTVFTHLLGPSNQVLGQKDGVPRDGAYPTTLWQPGEVVADTYTFAIAPDAPPGSYPLEIGMYRVETAKRLPVVGVDGQPLPDDRILLPEVNVLPALPPTPTPEPPEMPYQICLPLIVAGH
jgi:4-amino-4-deoxy-L-arabinose transferase-like glycosyltransferase